MDPSQNQNSSPGASPGASPENEKKSKSFFSFLKKEAPKKTPKSEQKTNPLFDFSKADSDTSTSTDAKSTSTDAKKKSKKSFFSFFKSKKTNTLPKTAPSAAQSQFSDIEIEKVGDKAHSSPSMKFPDTNLLEKNKKPEENILESIVSQQTGEHGKLILGPKPTKKVTKTVQYGVEKKLRSVKFVFEFAIFIFVLTFAFFKIQLDPDFKYLEEYFGYQTSAQHLAQLQDEIQNQQTEINYQNYVLAKFYLDKFVYLYNYHPIKDTDSLNLDEVKESLAVIQSKLTALLYPKDINESYMTLHAVRDNETVITDEAAELNKTYQDNLLAYINQKKSALQQDIDVEDDAKSELEILNSLPVLVQKRGFITNTLKSYDFENLDNKAFEKIIEEFNTISKNNFAIISNIKDQRINWTKNLKNIENITKQVDFYFGRENVEDLSKIFYNSYTFNAKSNTITVSAEIRTDDIKVFNQVLELIEAFDAAPEFDLMNEIRQFSKSEQEDKYTSSLQLILFINDINP